MSESNEGLNVSAWCHGIIDGVGGLNDFERYELAIPTVPDRELAAQWTLRCLANPDCKGSAEVLSAIIERRERLPK